MKFKILTLTILISHFALAQSDFSPKYSIDGNQIAFYSYRFEKEPEIFIINKDGTNLKQLTKTDGIWAIEPRWSNTEGLIGYSTGPNMSKLQIAKHNIKSGEISLIEGEGLQFITTWTKNGFEWGIKKESGFKFYLLNNKNQTNINVEFKGFSDYFAVPSRNRKFHVLSVKDKDNKGLWVVKNGKSKKIAEITGGNISISGDNKFIVFDSKENDVSNIYKLNLDGSNLSKITSDDSNDMMPTVHPNGNYVTFSSGRSGAFCLHTINLKTKEVKQITGL